jgi:hypothetical protein
MQSRWQLLLLVVLVLLGATLGAAKAQTITEFPLSTDPRGIVAAPDGALWFTKPGASKIGRITTSGVITEFPVGGIGMYHGWDQRSHHRSKQGQPPRAAKVTDSWKAMGSWLATPVCSSFYSLEAKRHGAKKDGTERKDRARPIWSAENH